MKYGKRSLWKKIMASPIVLVLLFIILAVIVRATVSVYKKAEQSVVKLSQTQNQLTKLKDRESDLSQKVNYLSTSEGVEAEIRTKFRAVRSGESVAVIVEDKDSASSTGPTATSSEENGSWFTRFFGL